MSAVFLAVCGVALLFAADVILPAVIPAFPVNGAWLGQALSAGWLGVAALNWLSQSNLLGGIYGRPVVAANAGLYFITATVLVKVVLRGDAHITLWLFFVPVVILAGIYAWLLYRGPIERDLEVFRGRSDA